MHMELSAAIWNEERYASLVANVPGAVYRCALSGGCDMEYMSPEVERVCGYPADEFIGGSPVRRYTSLIHAEDRAMVAHEIDRAVQREEPFELEYRLIHANGDVRWVQDRGRAIFGPHGSAQYLVGAIFDTTERKQLERQLHHLAYHDALTGLPNRAMFGDHVELAIAHAERHGGTVAVLFIDLDDFKLVNDQFGHAIGDMLLCEVAARLRSSARPTDVVARQSGDEFMALVAQPAKGSPAASAATAVANRIRGALREPVTIAGRAVAIGASIGIASYPDDSVSTAELLEHADTAMYRAKQSGGNVSRHYAGR
jgi:diguanylate cyclase (GGDEF)-like protein/PAS domain S-box-containing protein